MRRWQQEKIIADLEKKMVFIAGPRQAGKTTLAKNIGNLYKNTTYLNYDSLSDRKIILNESWTYETELLILDEIHKMPKWKNYLKGVYDTKKPNLKILVTGSARLDMFRKVGDSLAGRYFLHHLLPLSLAEINQVGLPVDLERLLKRGGFPEAYLFQEDMDARRWRLQYVDSLLREDVLDFAQIHDLKSMQLLFEMLQTRVSSPISYTSLAQDIGISVNTVKRYLQVFEELYLIFIVRPFHKNIARSILKEPKVYFFDVGLVKGDEGAALENLVALSLLKHTFYKRDYEAIPYSLSYLRTKEQKEVDFALVLDQVCEEMIEVKSKESNVASGIAYFHEKYGFDAVQICLNPKKERLEKGVKIMDITHYLLTLKL